MFKANEIMAIGPKTTYISMVSSGQIGASTATSDSVKMIKAIAQIHPTTASNDIKKALTIQPRVGNVSV